MLNNFIGNLYKSIYIFCWYFYSDKLIFRIFSIFIKAAKFRLKLLIKGNGCAGSTTNGVNKGKIDVVKKLLHQFFDFHLDPYIFLKLHLFLLIHFLIHYLHSFLED